MDGCWLQLHGNLTPAHAVGCAAQCFEGVQRGSLIILSVHPRPQAATPVSRPSFVAHLFGRGPALRTCNRVMAHRPTGSTQTDRIRLPYAASLNRFTIVSLLSAQHILSDVIRQTANITKAMTAAGIRG